MANTLPVNSCFPAIEDEDACVLILGSMPSIKSLEQQQYYAHPRNVFWLIMSSLFNMDKDLAYPRRGEYLRANKIAVWDVIKSCQRQGSLDQDIDPASMIANDFNLFLQQHPDIQQICFNGTKAEQVFNRYVLPTLSEQQKKIGRCKLPSTSPAHAAMKFEQKLALWQQALNL
jgi:TDG/mug DNA glycosylase family protein